MENIIESFDEIAMTKICAFLKKFFHKETAPAITVPEEDAFTRYGQAFHQTAACTTVESYASFHTTTEFAGLDNGYVRHCGPTALVNLLESLAKYRQTAVSDPVRLFRHVASFGRRRFFYYNTDFLKRFGGTLNISVPFYMKAVLRKCKFENMKVSIWIPARPFFLKRALDAGNVLFVILSFHPRYGAHHLMVYGYRELTSADGRKKKLYLVTSDGWSAKRCYLNADDLKWSSFVACHFKSEHEKSRQTVFS